MAKPLLPGLRPGTQTPTGFGAGDARTGLISITPDEALRDLIWKPGLRAEGVSHPVAAAEVFRWRLELGGQSEPEPRQVLELLLQCAFLGLVEIRGIPLERSSLKNHIRQISGAEELVTWSISAEGSRKIIAGRLGLKYPLFPSAWVQHSESNRIELISIVMKASNGALSRAGDRLVFTDPQVAIRFRQSLATLLGSTRDIPEPSPWREAIKELSKDERPGNAFPVHPGLIPPDVAREQWACPIHAARRNSWIEESRGRMTVISAAAQEIRCPIHPEAILLNSKGDNVNLEELGAAIVNTASGKRLYVWADAILPAHFTRLECGEQHTILAYWDANGPRIRLNGSVIRLENVLCRSVAMPVSQPHGASASIAIKPQYLDLIEQYDWNPAAMQWRVKFKGRTEFTLLEPPDHKQVESQDGVVVWPKSLPNESSWRKDIAAVFFGRSCDEAAPIVRDRNGYLAEKPYVKVPWIAEIEGRIEFVSLRKSGVDVGVIPIVRSAIKETRNRVGYVAIDFGTSNTSVVHIAEGDANFHYTPQGEVSPAETAHFATGGIEFVDSLKNSLVLHSAWYKRDQQGHKVDRLFGTLLLDRSTTDRGASILPRRSALLRNFRPAQDSRLHDDLKWQDPKSADRNALEQYLERAFARAFHELAAAGCVSAKVAATFPLAFDNSRKQMYESALRAALNRVSQSSGVALKDEDVRLFSESAAGVRGTPALGAHYSLTIDLGGGTTDLAVLDSDRRVVAVDSLKVGARGLLDVILRREPSALTTLQLDGLQVSPIVAIEAAVQENPAGVRSAFAPALRSAEVRQSLAATFAAVVVACASLLRATVQDAAQSVNVVLLGQGWQLMKQEILGPFDEQWFFTTLQEHVASICQTTLAEAPEDLQERKLALVRGALSLLTDNAEAARLFYEPPFVIGMTLQMDGKVLAADTRVQAVGRIDQVIGDGGFEKVVDELWAVLTRMSRKGFELGLEPVQLQKVQKKLCPMGVHLLIGDLSTGGRLSGSPLMRFLDRCWQSHWAGTSS